MIIKYVQPCKIDNNMEHMRIPAIVTAKKANEYDQEIPQSHTTNQPMSSRGRAIGH